MITVPVTFENLEGEMVTREYYFHLSKRELMQMVATGEIEAFQKKFTDLLKRLEIDTLENRRAVVEGFFDLLEMCVGQKLDNDTFIKTPEFRQAFINSDAAFAVLDKLMEDNGKNVEAFVFGMIPRSVMKMVEEAKSADQPQLPIQNAVIPAQAQSPENVTKRAAEYTHEELMAMTDAEFDELLRNNKQHTPRNVLVAGWARSNPALKNEDVSTEA